MAVGDSAQGYLGEAAVRLISAVVLAVALLAGCEGGERMNKWSSAPAPNNNPAMSGPVDPHPELKCLASCRSKAEEEDKRCAAAGDTAACKDKLSQERLQCETKCTPP